MEQFQPDAEDKEKKMTLNLVQICEMKYPNQVEKLNITFRKPLDQDLSIDVWNVENIPRPLESDLLAEEPLWRTTWELNQLQNSCFLAMIKLFNDVAKQKNYDDVMSIVSYYASTNNKWAQESQAFIAWRDACWNVALQILDEVQTGQRAAPSIEQFLSELPIIKWG